MNVYDDRLCKLGEGPLWHPERNQLFWFDITGQRMLGRDGGQQTEWTFDEMVSAAGWVDRDMLLVASETGLWRISLGDGTRELVTPLEASDPVTRSNDGRADPWGGFWIGTMGKQAEPAAGAIYRYYRGELRKLVCKITISNAICFSPDRSCAYYSDTVSGTVMRVRLEPDTGWPAGEAEMYLDLRADGLNPDGAVTDAEGNVWIAQWGAGRVAAYAPDARFLRAVPVAGRHTSCPAFGGEDLSTLFCTTARQGLDADTLASEPRNGMTFAMPKTAQGKAEPRVIL